MKSWCESCLNRDCSAKDEPCKSCFCAKTDSEPPTNYIELLSDPSERSTTGERCVSSGITHEQEKTEQSENKGGFEWIPVTERKPTVCKTVLIFDGKEMYTANYDKSRFGIGFVWRTINGYCNPRYWMPLPEPPEE